METQAVAVKQNNLPSTEFTSFIDEDIPTDKMIIPRIGLVQGTSEVAGEQVLGTYNNNVTGENYGESITVIPIKIDFGALYMVQGEGMKCKSVDGITNIHSGLCAQCPFGVYHAAEWRDGAPPKCQQTIDILVVEVSTGQPAVITFKSTKYKTGKLLVTNLKLTRQAKAIVLGSRREKNDKGNFHVIQIKAQKPLTPEQFQMAQQWKASFKNTKYDAAEEN